MKTLNYTVINFTILLIFLDSSFSSEPANNYLAKLYSNNSIVKQTHHEYLSENSKISEVRSLDNPRVGLMKEGEMSFVTLSQEVMFPSKYVSMGSMQNAMSNAFKEQSRQSKLQIRTEGLSKFYNSISLIKILELLKKQKELLLDLTKISETRRGIGIETQREEMMAHAELLMAEEEIILMEQEFHEMQIMVNQLIGITNQQEYISLPNDFALPKISTSLNERIAKLPEKSSMLKNEQFMLEQAQYQLSLARQSYLPDFMFKMTKQVNSEMESDTSFEIEMTIPLWFLSKQQSSIASANNKLMASKMKLENMNQSLISETEIFKNRVLSLEKLINLYQTNGLPQAQTTLTSQKSLYLSGKGSFADLIASEKAYYNAQIALIKLSNRYIDAILSLEQIVGISLSTLPFIED